MLPMMPYSGMLRPALTFLAILLSIVVLQCTRKKPYRRKLEWCAFAAYAFFLLYATFLSRTIAETYSYRLSVMGSARKAFSLDGNLWELLKGDFSLLRITDLRSLEGILINILLFVPLGFLLSRMWTMRWWQIMLIGAVVSAIIEIVQLVTRLGMLDVDDWIFNTLGTTVGIGLQRLLVRAEAHKQNNEKDERS